MRNFNIGQKVNLTGVIRETMSEGRVQVNVDGGGNIIVTECSLTLYTTPITPIDVVSETPAVPDASLPSITADTVTAEPEAPVVAARAAKEARAAKKK
jgi:hypothetical protein